MILHYKDFIFFWFKMFLSLNCVAVGVWGLLKWFLCGDPFATIHWWGHKHTWSLHSGNFGFCGLKKLPWSLLLWDHVHLVRGLDVGKHFGTLKHFNVLSPSTLRHLEIKWSLDHIWTFLRHLWQMFGMNIDVMLRLHKYIREKSMVRNTPTPTKGPDFTASSSSPLYYKNTCASE